MRHNWKLAILDPDETILDETILEIGNMDNMDNMDNPEETMISHLHETMLVIWLRQYC